MSVYLFSHHLSSQEILLGRKKQNKVSTYITFIDYGIGVFYHY